jgi:ankyrin repeat protein
LCGFRGKSPLFIASQSGHCDIVKYLMAHNADVYLCNSFGQSPLFIASKEGHCDIDDATYNDNFLSTSEIFTSAPFCNRKRVMS